MPKELLQDKWFQYQVFCVVIDQSTTELFLQANCCLIIGSYDRVQGHIKTMSCSSVYVICLWCYTHIIHFVMPGATTSLEIK